MSTTQGNIPTAMHVGQMIRAKMAAHRVSLAWMARKLGRDQRTVARSISRPSMQASIIWELSVALRHNFFADLAHQLDAATDGKLQQQQTELQQLRADYERLKEERDYLRRAIDLINK